MIPKNARMNIRSCKEEAIYRLNVGFNIDYKLAFNAMKEITELEDPSVRDVYLGTLLYSVMHNKVSAHEIKGLLDAAFKLDDFDTEKKLELDSNKHSITIMGSGKKGIKTFNITSLAVIVAAASKRLNIVKPCSKSTSSVSGSADFISFVGADINKSAKEMAAITKECGLGFFSIENAIPKFDAIYGGRFFAPHALSFALGGLLAPVKTTSTIYGLAHPNLNLSLEVFRLYNVSNLLVLTSTPDGIHFADDILPFGITYLQGYYNDFRMGNLHSMNVRHGLALPNYSQEDIAQRKTVKENILMGLSALSSKTTNAIVDTIAVNSATLLYMSRVVENLQEGYEYSISLIKSGAPIENLENFISLTNGDTKKFKALYEESKKFKI